jgi:D-beta-D-heptose 7-phosphate kinase / D-beta-D-heptose 1-phosphate adenosyltransferase
LFEKGKNPYRLYSEPQDNRRSIGAGDTFISALALAITSGADYKLSSEIGAAAASIILKKEGTVVCTSNDLKDYFNENPKYVADLKELSDKLKELKSEGKKIVFTNGCFDILHRGHVNFLNHAKAYGDVLVVGINTDESIRRVKGEERPINTLEDRIEVLSALHSVDYLISFEEDTSAELVKALSPDFFVKGGTYTIESIPEALLVKQMGGEVKVIPSTNHSTTSLIHKIRDVNFHPHQEKEYAKASGLE